MKSGGQPGNTNGIKGKPWTAALRREIAKGKGDALDKIAKRVLTQAKAGNIQAIREVSDRLDGKPVQGISHE